MHVSKLSEFIQSDVPSNNLLLIPNEFGTVFERNTIFAGTREAGNNFFKATRIAFCLCSPGFFIAINSTATLVHRTWCTCEGDSTVAIILYVL